MPLSPEDQLIVARIAYRSALWISYSDDDGGRTAQAQESVVLKRSIQSLQRKTRVGSDERKILELALAKTDLWHEWSVDLIGVIEDIQKHIEKISPTMRVIIMDIAKNVAMAFEERSWLSAIRVRMAASVRNRFTKMRPKMTPKQISSISDCEMSALRELAKALGVSNFLR